MLATYWQHAGNMLATCWQHAGNMLATCWQHAGNMLATYLQHAGNILLSLNIETFFKNVRCPLSSPYSVLLGGWLVAIRAQKRS